MGVIAVLCCMQYDSNKYLFSLNVHLKAVCSFSETVARKKYKSLRDTFRSELLKKVPTDKLGDTEPLMEKYQGTWPYFKLMFFLKDQILGRKYIGNLTEFVMKQSYDSEYFKLESSSSNSTSAQDNDMLDFETAPIQSVGHFETALNQINLLKQPLVSPCYSATHSLALEMVSPCHSSTPSASGAAQPPPKRRKSDENYCQKLIDIENKLELLQKSTENEQDTCRQFLLSILPFMKNMNEKQQCLFRVKVQQLVYNSLFPDSES